MSVMLTIVPPLDRAGHAHAVQRHPVACAMSALVLAAQGHLAETEAVRSIGAHITATPDWPEQICMCAVVPCTTQNWTHPGHCCRASGDHAGLFTKTHAQICPQHSRLDGGA